VGVSTVAFALISKKKHVERQEKNKQSAATGLVLTN
jgi:hypothetical protein